MHIENFKCFKNFDIELDKFNVLIGPNDSGKTAFLQAVLLAGHIYQHQEVGLHATRQYIGKDIGGSFAWRGNFSGIRMSVCYGEPDESMSDIAMAFQNDGKCFRQLPGKPTYVTATTLRHGTFGPIAYYHLDPEALRRGSQIITSNESKFNMAIDGSGFPTYLEDLLREDRKAFAEMEHLFYERFPHYHLAIQKEGKNNVISFTSRNDLKLSPQEVSDGAILYLAFLAICCRPNAPKILMIEEPENGVHFARLKDIMDALKSVAATGKIQIILTTHSPYLLDLVEPKDVRVFSKDGEGAVTAKKLSDYPDVERMKKHFMTGEIWTMLGKTESV